MSDVRTNPNVTYGHRTQDNMPAHSVNYFKQLNIAKCPPRIQRNHLRKIDREGQPSAQIMRKLVFEFSEISGHFAHRNSKSVGEDVRTLYVVHISAWFEM